MKKSYLFKVIYCIILYCFFDTSPKKALAPLAFTLWQPRIEVVRRIKRRYLERNGKDPEVLCGMSFNPKLQELFYTDLKGVARVIHLSNKKAVARDMFDSNQTAGQSYNICHMSKSDTLIVCGHSVWPEKSSEWVTAYSRKGDDWLEEQRIETVSRATWCLPLIGSRVLIAGYTEKPMELYRVDLQPGQRITRVGTIKKPERFHRLSVSEDFDGDPLLAMICDKSVLVYRLIGERLEKVTQKHFEEPWNVLWLADHLLVEDIHYKDGQSVHNIVQLELKGTQLIRRRELISAKDEVQVGGWCVVNNGLAIYDFKSKNILFYSIN